MLETDYITLYKTMRYTNIIKYTIMSLLILFLIWNNSVYLAIIVSIIFCLSYMVNMYKLLNIEDKLGINTKRKK